MNVSHFNQLAKKRGKEERRTMKRRNRDLKREILKDTKEREDVNKKDN